MPIGLKRDIETYDMKLCEKYVKFINTMEIHFGEIVHFTN